MAAKPAAGKKKAGLPMWAWAVAAVLVLGAFLLFRRGGGSTASPAPSGGAQDSTSSSGGGGITDAALGSILQHDEAQQGNLLAGILGAQSALVDVNSNLTSGLINSQNAIVGLGQTALEQSGAVEQAVIAHMGATGSGGGGSTTNTTTNITNNTPAPAPLLPYATSVPGAVQQIAATNYIPPAYSSGGYLIHGV